MQNDNQRILLLNPPPPAVGDLPAGAGLPHIADLLREAGLAAELLNAELSPANENEIVAQIATRAPRILLLDQAGASPIYPMIAALSSRVKQPLPQTIIILGGLSPCRPWRAPLLQCPAIDFVIHSEGRQTALQLLRALLTHRVWACVPGIAYRDTKGQPCATRRGLR